MEINRLKPKKSSGRHFILKQLKYLNNLVIKDFITREDKILDFGCGDSPYEPLYLKKCKEYYKADFAGNPKAEILINSEELLPENISEFDVVLSTQVLEHVSDVEIYLKEVKRALKKNGVLILSTHGYWMRHPHPNDYWRWTSDGLIKTIEDSGFKVKINYGIMNLAASGLQLFQDGTLHRVPKVLRKFYFRIILCMQNVVDKGGVNHKDASVYLIVAKLKND